MPFFAGLRFAGFMGCGLFILTNGAILVHGTFHHLFGCFFCNILIFKQYGGVLHIGVQRLQHGPCRGVAVLRELGHGLFGDLHQRVGHLRCQLMQRAGLVRDLLDGNLHHVICIKGQMTGEHLVHHDTYRVDVAGTVGLVPLGLLRADIMHAAHGLTGQQLIICPGNACDAEIHHAQLAIIQQHNILGLDVPVHDAVGVGMLQRFEDLGNEVHGLPAGKLTTTLVEVLAQGHAVHILHNDILQMVVDRNVVHLDDVGVVQQRDGLGLILEAAHKVRVVHIFLPQHLDSHHSAGGHRAVLSPHDRLIHIGHTTGADQLLHLVQAVQPLTDQVIHGAPPSALPPPAGR